MKRNIFLIIIFILLLSNVVIASDEHYLEYYKNGQKYKFVTAGELRIYKPSSDYILQSSSGKIYSYRLEGSTWVLLTNGNAFSINPSDMSSIKTNYNIYFGDSVFFSVLEMWEAGMKEANLLGTIQTLLPIILGLVISGLALRKGWKMLRTQLLGA